MAALRDGSRLGLTERELGDLVERAYVAQGATNVIHYIGATSMRVRISACRGSFRRTRRVQAGDVVVAEISAAFWDHPGQVLRSFALGGADARSIAICTRRRMRRSTPSPRC